jgi:D-methionine transport system ATP-binding protein
MFHAMRPLEAADPLVPAQDSSLYSSDQPALSLAGIEKRFAGNAAVDGVSLDVPRGSIYGVIGRSGAGKSTLLRVASLLEAPDAGEVLHSGRRVSGLSGAELRAARRRIGIVFQAFNLFSARSAAGNVAFPLEAAGVDRRVAEARVAELLELVGLPDKAARPVSRLSGGERQRVAIARALALEPELLFCDEATSALDPETTRAILDLIAELKTRLGLTVVMVTHQMEVVRRVCDSVAVIEAGKIEERASAAELFARPRSAAAKRLVAQSSFESGEQRRPAREEALDA